MIWVNSKSIISILISWLENLLKKLKLYEPMVVQESSMAAIFPCTIEWLYSNILILYFKSQNNL